MKAELVEVLVEERSTEEALRLLLPKMLGDTEFSVHAFRCKDEMLMRLPQRLRGYAKRRENDPWFRDHARILIVVDRDDDDCVALKTKLEQMARDAGLATRQQSPNGVYAVVTRLAIEELEAWYFGDWAAVRACYPKVSATIPTQAKYRHPDAIKGGTWEAFERVLKAGGYFSGGLRKIEAARAIAPHMDPRRNESPSFRSLAAALRDLSASWSERSPL